MGKQKDAKNKKDKGKRGLGEKLPNNKLGENQKRVVGFAYLKAFMKPTPSSRTPRTQNDLTIINILLSIFAILLSIIIEIVKDEHDTPIGLDNMLGAVSLFSIIVAVFITHALIGPKRHSKWQLWQPFLGGWRFVTMQSVAWSLLAISLYLSGLALHPAFAKIYPTHLFGASFPSIWTLTCLMGLLAEFLLISSLPLFESPNETPSSIQLRWNDVGTINIIVSVIAMLTFFFLEKLRPLHNFSGPHVNQILTGAAGACIFIAIVLTHMIVGKMCHGSNWKWWQAFEGGWRFVLMQGVSWCLFSLAVLVGAWSMRNTVILDGTWTLTGTLGFLSELIMVISIQMYLPSSESSNASPGSTQAWMNNASVLGKRARRFLVTVLLFNVFFAPVMVMISFAIPFLFASAWLWGSVVTLVVAVYAPTFFLTSPHRTGAMDSAKLRTSFLVEDVIRYFNGCLVKTAEIDPSKQYIFGYHPHGILPIAAMWATNTPGWRQFQSEERDTVTLIASHLFCIPVTREFLAAGGAREVSKASFKHALDQGKSVVLVPGGMKEMRESLSTMDDIVVCKSHKGFIKMAITHGVDLIPLFSFGETKLLDCAFPELQKFCWKNLGIPFPLFIGRWGLPVPRPQQVTILVGPAIHVTQNSDPSEEEVEAIAEEYFSALGEMFEKHKKECGHEQSKIIWK